MDDSEIQSTVESILGPDAKILDCEKKSCTKEEEVLTINGVQITLDEPDGAAIREAMVTGQVPPCDLLNRILLRAGIQRVPVRLETSLDVKSSIVTKEEVTVSRAGKIVDERSNETKENNCYSSTTSEIWEPVGLLQRKPKPKPKPKPFENASSDDSRPNSNASSDQGYTTNVSGASVPRERGGAGSGPGTGAHRCCCAAPSAAVGGGRCTAECCSAGLSGLGLEGRSSSPPTARAEPRGECCAKDGSGGPVPERLPVGVQGTTSAVRDRSGGWFAGGCCWR